MFLMTMDEVNLELEKINDYLSKCLWMDFEICQLNGGKIVVAGRIDTSYNNFSIEMEFEQPYCISSILNWSVDTSKQFIELASDDEVIEMSRKYRIEQGNYVFKIYMEDFESSAIYIAAKKVKCIIINDKPF